LEHHEPYAQKIEIRIKKKPQDSLGILIRYDVNPRGAEALNFSEKPKK
jgi:hypothetical protein